MNSKQEHSQLLFREWREDLLEPKASCLSRSALQEEVSTPNLESEATGGPGLGTRGCWPARPPCREGS